MRTNNIALRLVLDGALLASIVMLKWWWLSVAIAFVIFLIYRGYEAVLGGVLIDVVYGSSVDTLWGVEYVFTIAFILLLGLSLVLRRFIMLDDGTIER